MARKEGGKNFTTYSDGWGGGVGGMGGWGRFLPPWHYLRGKGGYVLGSVGLSVCLSVCGQHYSKRYERIGVKFYGVVLGSTMN